MLKSALRSLFILIALVVLALPIATRQNKAKVILVDMRVQHPDEAKECFSEKFDHKKIELEVELDDPIYQLDDLALSEEPLVGPGCFMPEMKIIFPKYTYVFSLYCTSIVKFSNQQPFTPSNKMVKSDLKMTEPMLEFLQEIRKKYFDEYFNPEIAKRFVKNFKLPDVNASVDDSVLDKDVVDPDDKILEREAIDKEGLFDGKEKDPDLDEDESPDDDING